MNNDSQLLTEFIVYVCPTGELADQINHYFAESWALCGENAAHRYMPHITLTGFFHDVPASIPAYVQVLDRLVANLNPSEPLITIQKLTFRDNFHGLELESPQLKQMIQEFKVHSESPTRTDAIRPKDWLHVSLAYDFSSEQQQTLQELAESIVDLSAPVAWQLRLYERQPNNTWINHYSWSL